MEASHRGIAAQKVTLLICTTSWGNDAAHMGPVAGIASVTVMDAASTATTSENPPPTAMPSSPMLASAERATRGPAAQPDPQGLGLGSGHG